MYLCTYTHTHIHIATFLPKNHGSLRVEKSMFPVHFNAMFR